MKNFFSKINLVRIGLAAAAVAIILLLLPHADHQSYSYELNQPWKYPLLTADFDMPIMRDSASANAMRDSIDRAFIPIVKRKPQVAVVSLAKFSKITESHFTPKQASLAFSLLKDVYSDGVIGTKVYDAVYTKGVRSLRIADNSEGPSSVSKIDVSGMRSPAKAFEYIDSLYRLNTGEETLPPEMAKALNICINPNVVVDTVNDTKYRNQEYLNVTGATGIIKKGQRIVDRGEIVNPQIFTNLNTYMQMLDTNQGETAHTYFTIGQALYIIIAFTVLYLFLACYRKRFFGNVRQMSFLMLFITLFVIFTIVMFEYVPNGIYLVPYAAVPVIILVFFDARTAIFSLLTTVLIAALVATFQFQFIFMELTVGLIATFSIRQLSRRSQLLRTALFTFLTYVVTYFAICLISEGNLSQFQWRTVGLFAINAVILSFAYILILLFEKTFGFTSTVTLVELSDINNPLLRRLAEEAPGTFQHSMQVSTLATEAARAIGANTTLVRTGALYHDIGKLESPVFFTENQHGVNPHEGLDPETSAQKIISHVTAGLTLASKEKLPAKIKDFISEHHGKGITRYFYNTAVNRNPDKTVDIEKFRYPGPNPRSKETAILMMADSVEAASRSLKDYSPESINTLVDRIIDTQMHDGLFKDSPISFKDVETVKDTFKKRLATIYHSRVAYPEIKKKTTDETPKSAETAKTVETDKTNTVP